MNGERDTQVGNNLARWVMRQVGILLLALALPACGDDGLGKSFQPRPPGDSDENLGGPLPIAVGDTFWYQFSQTHRRSTSANQGTGLIEGEKQAVGHLCLKVAEVRDTNQQAYRDRPETVLVARAKIVGGINDADIVFSDQDATGAPEASVVEAALTNLWLKKLAVPLRGHGLLTPTNKEFHTRAAPTPPGQELAYLPFFDVRTSVDKAWGGWSYTNDACADQLEEGPCVAESGCRWDISGQVCLSTTLNFLNDMLIYFISTYGVTFYTDNTRFQERHPVSSNCPSYATLQACQMAQCTWDFMANGGAGACITLFSIDVRWRETQSTGPAELQGPVLHRVRLEYNEDGSLRAGDEIIAPDPNPGTPLAADLTNFTGCFDNQACAVAKFELDDRTWGEAYCTF